MCPMYDSVSFLCLLSLFFCFCVGACFLLSVPVPTPFFCFGLPLSCLFPVAITCLEWFITKCILFLFLAFLFPHYCLHFPPTLCGFLTFFGQSFIPSDSLSDVHLNSLGHPHGHAPLTFGWGICHFSS